MRNLVAFPLLILAALFQSAILGRITLLSGHADILVVLLAAWALQERVTSAWHWAFFTSILIGFISRLPWPVTVIGYFSVVYMAQLLQRRVWQAPLLAMFAVTFAGTVWMHLLSFLVLRFLGHPLPIGEVLSLITLPSLLLNMLFAIPIYAWMRDLAHWVYPSETGE
jgi:cell shape-determining protein MreD